MHRVDNDVHMQHPKGPPITWLDISGNGIGHACLAGIKRLRLRGRGRLEVIAIRNASLDDQMFLLLSKVIGWEVYSHGS